MPGFLEFILFLMFVLVVSQCFLDFAGQIAARKWFCDECDILIEYAVVGDDIGRVAGHKQGFYGWVDLVDLFRQLLPVHAGHHDIGQQELNSVRLLFEQPESIMRSFRQQDGVSKVTQKLIIQGA